MALVAVSKQAFADRTRRRMTLLADVTPVSFVGLNASAFVGTDEPGESPLSLAMADLDKALADAAKARSMFDVDSAQKQLGPLDFDKLNRRLGLDRRWCAKGS